MLFDNTTKPWHDQWSFDHIKTILNYNYLLCLGITIHNTTYNILAYGMIYKTFVWSFLCGIFSRFNCFDFRFVCCMTFECKYVVKHTIYCFGFWYLIVSYILYCVEKWVICFCVIRKMYFEWMNSLRFKSCGSCVCSFGVHSIDAKYKSKKKMFWNANNDWTEILRLYTFVSLV